MQPSLPPEHPAARKTFEVPRPRVDDLRDERHDACAKTICAGTFADRRRGRTQGELQMRREELKAEWIVRQKKGKKKSRK
jgi:hypothetical protein